MYVHDTWWSLLLMDKHTDISDFYDTPGYCGGCSGGKSENCGGKGWGAVGSKAAEEERGE